MDNGKLFEANYSQAKDQTRIRDRRFDEYQKGLKFNPEKLKGKEVLDIGAGWGIFQDEAIDRGVKKVISVDPFYDTKYYKVRDYGNAADNKVAGVNEYLSFKDETFDVVFAHFSSFFYLKQQYENLEKRMGAGKMMVREIIRVLRPGGEARVSVDIYSKEDLDFFRDLFEQNKKENRCFHYQICRLAVSKKTARSLATDSTLPTHYIILRKDIKKDEAEE